MGYLHMHSKNLVKCCAMNNKIRFHALGQRTSVSRSQNDNSTEQKKKKKKVHVHKLQNRWTKVFQAHHHTCESMQKYRVVQLAQQLCVVSRFPFYLQQQQQHSVFSVRSIVSKDIKLQQQQLNKETLQEKPKKCNNSSNEDNGQEHTTQQQHHSSHQHLQFCFVQYIDDNVESHNTHAAIF